MKYRQLHTAPVVGGLVQGTGHGNPVYRVEHVLDAPEKLSGWVVAISNSRVGYVRCGYSLGLRWVHVPAYARGGRRAYRPVTSAD